MNASGATARRCIRVLSPRIEPPETWLVGSIASTATRLPAAIRRVPSSSMNVDLPTPGTPVIPIRRARPVAGSSRCRSCCASVASLGSRLSISVTARASTPRSHARTPVS